MTKGDNGFIKLYRSIMDWGWYCDSNTSRLFLHCLLKANYTEKEWQGITIPRGSFITSYEKLAEELSLTTSKIRTSISNLIKTNNITHKTTNRYSIITVNNYSSYQNNDTRFDNQIATKSQTNNNQIATTYKRNKGIKEEHKNRSKIFEELKEMYKESGKL